MVGTWTTCVILNFQLSLLEVRLGADALDRTDPRLAALARARRYRTERRGAAAAGQRSPRVARGLGEAAPGRAAGRAAGRDRGGDRCDSSGRRRQGHQRRHDRHRNGSRRLGRQRPAPADRLEPALERRAIHAAGRQHRHPDRAGRAEHCHRRARFGNGRARRLPAARVRALPPGRDRPDARARRPRTGPGDRAAPGGAAWRYGDRVE